MSDELAGIIRKVEGTPQSFVDWVVQEELWSPADVGAVCKDEEKVSALITQQLVDHGTLRTKHKSAVVRIWWLCRTAMSREESLATGRCSAPTDGPLDPDVAEPCHTAWWPSVAAGSFRTRS